MMTYHCFHLIKIVNHLNCDKIRFEQVKPGKVSDHYFKCFIKSITKIKVHYRNCSFVKQKKKISLFKSNLQISGLACLIQGLTPWSQTVWGWGLCYTLHLRRVNIKQRCKQKYALCSFLWLRKVNVGIFCTNKVLLHSNLAVLFTLCSYFTWSSVVSYICTKSNVDIQ